jgi:Possible hemagglutinin (DUF637)
MSADPFIQAPDNLQSYNRYAYVMNNPLTLVDPSGYFSMRKLVAKVAFGVFGHSKTVRQLITLGACMSGNPALCGLASGLNAYVSGASLGQAVKTGAISWATAEGFEWAGQQGPAGSAPASQAAATSFERYAAHAAVGCVSSAVGGGQCGSGAASAVFGKFATNTIGGPGVDADFGEVLAKGIATAVAGGVGSVIAGGKFENGAMTAAYGYMFNALSSVGVNVRVPLVGGAKFAVGVSYENGEWDAGVIIDSDVPTLSASKFLARGTVEIGSQTGDFLSNKGALNLNGQVGAGGVGLSVQRDSSGPSGLALSVGPQLGVSVSAQQTRTVSVRYDVLPAIQAGVERVKSWIPK